MKIDKKNKFKIVVIVPAQSKPFDVANTTTTIRKGKEILYLRASLPHVGEAGYFKPYRK